MNTQYIVRIAVYIQQQYRYVADYTMGLSLAFFEAYSGYCCETENISGRYQFLCVNVSAPVILIENRRKFGDTFDQKSF